jgi:hypothetical protein
VNTYIGYTITLQLPAGGDGTPLVAPAGFFCNINYANNHQGITTANKKFRMDISDTFDAYFDFNTVVEDTSDADRKKVGFYYTQTDDAKALAVNSKMEFTIHFYNAPSATKNDISITVSVENLTVNGGWKFIEETVTNIAFAVPATQPEATFVAVGQWTTNLGKIVAGVPTTITFSFS